MGGSVHPKAALAIAEAPASPSAVETYKAALRIAAPSMVEAEVSRLARSASEAAHEAAMAVMTAGVRDSVAVHGVARNA